MGVFRLINAEFSKMLKKPSMYIMTIVLIISTAIAIFTFKPMSYYDTNIKIDKEISKAIVDVKTNYLPKYDLVIENSFKNVDYYVAVNMRENDILTKLNAVDKIYKNYGNYVNKNTFATEFMVAINNYSFAINNFKKFETNEIYLSLSTNKLLLDINKLFDDYKLKLNTTPFYNNNQYDGLKIYEDYSKMNRYEMLNENSTNNINFIEYSFNNSIKNILSSFNVYKENALSNKMASQIAEIENNRVSLLNEIDKMILLLNIITNYNTPAILIDKDKALDIEYMLTNSKTTLSINSSVVTNISSHRQVVNTLLEQNFDTKINGFKNSMVMVKIDNQTLSNLINNYKVINQNKIEIKNKIDICITNSELNALVTKYSELSNLCEPYILDNIKLSISDHMKIKNINALNKYDFDMFNKYQINEKITLNNFYINSNTYRVNYLENVSFNQKSSPDTNMYDFMFYAMKIASLFIVIFAILLSVGLVSSEIDSGTIKLLLIRPYKRWKILLAKILSVILFVVLFLVVSLILSFVGGLAIYGFPPVNTVVAVFNGQFAFTMPAVINILLFSMSLFLEIIFYIVLIFMICVIVKDYGASISIGIILYLATFVLNLLFGNKIFYSYLPTSTLNLFMFFGNSFLGVSDTFKNILITPMLSNMNFYISLVIYGLSVVILNFVSFLVFSKKDY